jgi:hypothetical protein
MKITHSGNALLENALRARIAATDQPLPSSGTQIALSMKETGTLELTWSRTQQACQTAP